MPAVQPHRSRLRRHSSARRLLVFLSVFALVALAPASADAHRLSKAKATTAAGAAAQGLGQAMDGVTTSDGGQVTIEKVGRAACKRASAHVFNCPVGAFGSIAFTDGTSAPITCVGNARIRYASHKSKKPSFKISGVTCALTAAPAGNRAGSRSGMERVPLR